MNKLYKEVSRMLISLVNRPCLYFPIIIPLEPGQCLAYCRHSVEVCKINEMKFQPSIIKYILLLTFEYECSNIETLALIYGYYLQFPHPFGRAPMPRYVASVTPCWYWYKCGYRTFFLTILRQWKYIFFVFKVKGVERKINSVFIRQSLFFHLPSSIQP